MDVGGPAGFLFDLLALEVVVHRSGGEGDAMALRYKKTGLLKGGHPAFIELGLQVGFRLFGELRGAAAAAGPQQCLYTLIGVKLPELFRSPRLKANERSGLSLGRAPAAFEQLQKT